MKTLKLKEMEQIEGGKGFCNAFYVGSSLWAVGAMANLWNPLGIAAGLAFIAVSGYCEFS